MRGRRVLRGQVTDGLQEQLIIDDGNFNDAWRIIKFTVAGDAVNSNEVMGKLSTDQVPTVGWNWADNREIAWASSRNTTEANWGGFPNAVVPDHVVVASLYITGQSSAGSIINYMIEIERVRLDDDQAILALIQERSQDDL